MKKGNKVKTKFGIGEIVAVENPDSQHPIYKVYVKNANSVLSFNKSEIQEV